MIAARADDLLGLIYDAPFDPDLWSPAMELLGDELGGGAACMTELDIVTGEGGGRAVRVPDDTMGTYLERWADDNPLLRVPDPARYIDQWQLAIVRSEEWIDPDALKRSSYFNEFLRPIAAEHSIMIRLSITGTRVSTIAIGRPTRGGIFTDQEVDHARRWQAHLVRAERIGRRMRVDRAALEAVDRLAEDMGKRLFFLDRRGRIRRMSAAADRALAAGGALRVEAGMLVAASAGDDERLQRLIALATGRWGGERRGGAMTLSVDARRSATLSVMPLGPRSVASWSDEPLALVSLDDPRPAPASFSRRHGLTPAETRVALALAEGRPLGAVAAAAGVSINTVRAQLGSIFSKTGCRRQAELVRLVLAGD